MSGRLLQKMRAAVGLGLICLGGVSLASGVPAGYRRDGAERVRHGNGNPPTASARATEHDTLFQTSPINALLDGIYDGDMSVAALARRRSR